MAVVVPLRGRYDGEGDIRPCHGGEDVADEGHGQAEGFWECEGRQKPAWLSRSAVGIWGDVYGAAGLDRARQLLESGQDV